MQKKIFVYGYRQMNLGDDLFFYILFLRYRETRFVMFAPKKYKEIYGQFKNVKIYTENKLLLAANRILSNMLKGNNIRTWVSRFCDAGVLIIGSCFGETKDKKYYYEPKIEAVKNVYVIGANVAQVYTEHHLEKVGEYLAKCEDICFREKRSRDFFPYLPNVRMAPDVVFQIGKKKKVYECRKRVLFSIIDMSVREKLKPYAEEYEKLIYRLVDFFKKLDYEIQFMSFCEREGDDAFVKKVLMRYKGIDIRSGYYQYSGKIEEALEQIQKCEIIIATRFHSMILAWAYKKKVLPIIYNDKMRHVIDDYGYGGSYVELQKLGDFLEKNIIKWLDEDIFDSSQCIDESDKQFRGLDEFIYGRKESN